MSASVKEIIAEVEKSVTTSLLQGTLDWYYFEKSDMTWYVQEGQEVTNGTFLGQTKDGKAI